MRAMNHVKTAILLGALMGLCMLVGHWFLGPSGVLFGLLFGGLGNFVAFFYSDKIALTAMRAREVQRGDSPELFHIVERLAERAGLPMPRVYVCPQPAPNAFATGRDPQHAAVAVTEGMLRTMSAPQIEGVLAHELGHVKHRDVLISTLAAVIGGADQLRWVHDVLVRWRKPPGQSARLGGHVVDAHSGARWRRC